MKLFQDKFLPSEIMAEDIRFLKSDGISLAFVAIVDMGFFRYRTVKQLEKYQTIADAYAQLDTVLEEGKENCRKKRWRN